jgi:hypothetical protein
LRWTLRRRLLQRHPSLTIHLSDHILAILEGLCEVADRTHNIFVAVDGQRKDWNEAERKPWVSFDHSRGPISLQCVSFDLW